MRSARPDRHGGGGSETIEKGDILSVEAGTGTGKSLAYLVPTVMSMKRRGCKAVISTNTINLQEQLLTKDIPLLASAMGEEIKAVLVKGRSNLRVYEKT